MRRRPIGQLLSFFQKGGVDVIYNQQHGHFPFSLNTRTFNSNSWTVDATKSSQILSALMMIAPLLGRSKTINFPNGTVSLPFLSITKDMIKDFSGDPNFNCDVADDQIKISAQYHRKDDFSYKIEPDATAASYFLTLPLIIGGKCNVVGISDEMLKVIQNMQMC